MGGLCRGFLKPRASLATGFPAFLDQAGVAGVGNGHGFLSGALSIKAKTYPACIPQEVAELPPTTR
jgi:hypothetical protein